MRAGIPTNGPSDLVYSDASALMFGSQLLAAVDQTHLPILLPAVPRGSSPEGRSQTHSVLLSWPLTETRSGLRVFCVGVSQNTLSEKVVLPAER